MFAAINSNNNITPRLLNVFMEFRIPYAIATIAKGIIINGALKVKSKISFPSINNTIAIIR